MTAFASIAKAPEFDWKPISDLPSEGKFLILQINRKNNHNDITIGTFKAFPEMNEALRKQQLKWAVRWEYFPNFVVRIDNEPSEAA